MICQIAPPVVGRSHCVYTMALDTLFAVLKAEAAERAEALRLALLRRRFVLEWELERARLWAQVERSLTPAHWREIRAWRTEP